MYKKLYAILKAMGYDHHKADGIATHLAQALVAIGRIEGKYIGNSIDDIEKLIETLDHLKHEL